MSIIQFPVSCKICTEVFDSSMAYKRHIEKVHSLEWLSYLREYHPELGGYCLECGKETSFVSLPQGFKRFCSNKCGKKSQITQNKTKSTKQERYGDSGYTNKEKANKTKLERYGTMSYNNREKAKETCLEKYGCENPFQAEEVKDKIKSVHLSNLGVEYPSQSKEVQEKIINSYKERYGVDWICKSEIIVGKGNTTKLERYGTETYNNREQATQTCLERYGCENPRQNKDIQEKIKETCREKYGSDYTVTSSEVQEKIKTTCLEKYGTESPLASSYVHKKTVQSHRANRYENNKKVLKLFKNIELLDTKEEYINNEVHRYFCSIHGEFESVVMDGLRVICPSCYSGYNGVSTREKEISEFLTQYFTIESSNRTILGGKELDIYVPEKNLAIEFDGLYWHNNSRKEKNYHLDKTEECEKHGIQLVHIFENEWLNKRPIVESILLAKLGIFQKRIYGRKCSVKIVSQETYREFSELNHLQGYVRAPLVLGLYHEDELVEICSFGKSRFKSGENELLRHCSKLHHQVIGGFSKLIKAWKKLNPGQELFTYCDRRYSTGKSYITSGWEHVGTSAPNYFYIVNNSLVSRIKYQKHKLSGILETFDSDLTEQENMSINGYAWIYDCGNLKFKI